MGLTEIKKSLKGRFSNSPDILPFEITQRQREILEVGMRLQSEGVPWWFATDVALERSKKHEQAIWEPREPIREECIVLSVIEMLNVRRTPADIRLSYPEADTSRNLQFNVSEKGKKFISGPGQ